MLTLIAGLFGLMFGSAINAIVWRLKVGRSWVHGRSVCPECDHKLAAKDLVPVFSWLYLRGKCRYCSAPIKDHPVVEIITAAAFALSAYVLNPTGWIGAVALAFWLVILVLLIILAVYDAKWLILPDKIVTPLIIVALINASVIAILTHHSRVLEGALAAALIGGGFFYAIVLFSKGKMGGGDIKLAFAMGLILGLKGLAVALLFAFNSAAILGMAAILMHKRTAKDPIPFGPYLVGGTILSFLYAQALVNWYLGINGLS